MNILGISAFYHDSAAALVRDGEIVAAAQEERFTRKKHDAGFPVHAVRYCLAEGGVGRRRAGRGGVLRQADHQVRAHPGDLLQRGAARAASFMMAMPLWLREKLWIPLEIEKRWSGGVKMPKRSCISRAPRVARRQRLLPSPFPRGHPDPGRRGRVGHQHLGRGEGNRLEILESCASRIRSGCSIPPSPTSPASGSTPASTSSWAWRPTASPKYVQRSATTCSTCARTARSA
jgi:carbamoyltransferase